MMGAVFLFKGILDYAVNQKTDSTFIYPINIGIII